MASSHSTDRCKFLESRAVAAAQASAVENHNAALEAATNSAELYMQALRFAKDPVDRRRIESRCREMLARAEAIKAMQQGKPAMAKAYPGDMKQPISTRTLTTRENIILLEGSKLNGTVCKPWTQPPTKTAFELKEGEEMYLEQPHLSLSEAQMKSFAGWQRPKEALALIQLTRDGTLLSNDPTMIRNDRIDLVQDMTSDCSVVASLCAGTARAERGHPRILGSILYPYDYEQDQIVMSPNGKYILRLYFNGCWRQVEIDDLLPTSSTSRVLHVIDRRNPGLLWPALVEKAYLKVRGGYDFPGSNSGTDLAVLTGWIPQQVFLHDEDVDSDELWSELYAAFETGDMLLTIGTGKLPRREQRQLGIAAEHDYAVLELKVSGSVREMLIKNPWSDGDVWVGATRRRQNPGYEHGKDAEPFKDDPEMMPGTFWMDFNSVFHYFENMYINWNPGRFVHRQDHHISWNIQGPVPAPNVLVQNPQFSVRSSWSGEMWLLLNRHFRTGDYTQASTGKNGYISLYLFDSKDGTQILSSDGALMRGPFVDAPNTLLRFHANANAAYTAVVVSQDLPPGKHNFTMSAFSNSSIVLERSSARYPNCISVEAAWTRSTAGGNSDSLRYLDNPQFNFHIATDHTKVALVLRITSDSSTDPDETNIHVKLLVVSNPTGRRVTKIRPRDIVANSADYRRGSVVIETTLDKGSHAIICSTFEEDQLAKFELTLYVSTPYQNTTLIPIPSESSGRFEIMSPPVLLADSVTKVVAPLTLPRTTRAIFIARPAPTRRGQKAEVLDKSTLFKISLQHGQGPYARVVASSVDESSEFTNLSSGGLRIEDQSLSPRTFGADTGGLWLVLERPAGQASSPPRASDGDVQSPLAASRSGQAIQIEVFADEKLEIGEWRVVSE